MRYPGGVTRRPAFVFAILLFAGGCTVLANNALPDSSSGGTGGNAEGGSAGTGGAPSGTPAGAQGGGGAGEGGSTCEPVAANELDCLDEVDDDCDMAVDCADSACLNNFECRPHVADAEFVLDGATSCPNGYQALPIATCEDCACPLDTTGTCSFQTRLWENSTCSGEPTEILDVQLDECTNVTVTADAGDTVGAMAELQSLTPPTCELDGVAVTSQTRTLCRLANVGMCSQEGLGCVPKFVEGTVCALLDGDQPCPTTHATRELVFTGTSAMCPCDCGPGVQTCDDSKHTHAQHGIDCPGTYTSLNDGDPCTDTGEPTIFSVDNHDATLPAKTATCENKTPPTGGMVKTLCCE